MPNSVLAATPSLVLPWVAAIAFQQSRTYFVDNSRYGDGSMQARAIPTTSRKRWTLTARLKPTDLAALRSFYTGQFGAWKEFYFYDVYETSPIFTYDNTGASGPGRYIVRFDGPFQQSLDLGRNPAQLSLVEVS